MKRRFDYERPYCPLDGKPCEKDCPDRFHDTPDGGCQLTIVQDMGGKLLFVDGQEVIMLL